MNNWTGIFIAIIGIIPGVLGWLSARRTRRSMKLAGSDLTVSNWNKLIKNLYEHIDGLNLQLDRERKRSREREAELETEIDRLNTLHEAEKQSLLAEIARLKGEIIRLASEIERLQKRITDTLDGTKANLK